MSLSLFGISQEFKAIQDLIENDVEANPETGEVIDNTEVLNNLWNELKLSLEEKLDNCQRYILTLNGEADILTDEIRRLQDKKKALDNKAQRLQDLMLNTLETAQIQKIKSPLYSYAIRKSESVEVVDIENLPRQFLRIKKEADKKAIKEYLKSGEIIEGCYIKINTSLGVK